MTFSTVNASREVLEDKYFYSTFIEGTGIWYTKLKNNFVLSLDYLFWVGYQKIQLETQSKLKAITVHRI